MNNYKEYLDPDNGYALVKQIGNMPLAPHWIEVPDEAELYVYWPHDKDYHFQSGQGFYEDGGWNLCSFSVEEIKKGDAGAEILWSREPIQEQGLISGAEALIAIGKGERVQYSFDDDQYWQADIANLKITDFGSGHFQFRLKPRTIKLEIEIPAPFEPKEGEQYWFLSPRLECGYDWTRGIDDNQSLFITSFGCWRTEEEIKQVVAAWRGGIKG
ncbi:hypothetical protein SB581_12205 [Acinetobacter baumannii]|nr:hypothetical protein SB581_12205 [Acinetobacter baumannii]